MALPRPKLPTYHCYMHSLGKEIEYRPFLVKDQKILMMQKDDKSTKTAYKLIADLVNECTLGKIDALDLCPYDLEILFLRMRAKSEGNVIKLKYKYTPKDDNEKNMTQEIIVELDLDEVGLYIPEEKSNLIDIGDDIFVQLRFPTLRDLFNAGDDDAKMFTACIDKVIQGDDVHELRDEDQEEIEAWVEELSPSAIEKIADFYKSMPCVRHTVTVPLPNGDSKEVTLTGIQDFFG